MPKICKHTYSLRLEGTSKGYEVDIMYSTKDGFYAKIPSEFSEIVEILSDDERRERNIAKQYKGSMMNRTITSVIEGSTEKECKDNFNSAVRFLSTKQLVEKPVILLYYETNNTTSFGSEYYNKGYESIGMRMGIGYGKEIRVGNGKPSYKVLQKNDYNPDWTGWGDVHDYRPTYKVIDDTPENRLFVEDLYNRFKDLQTKLNNLTKSPDSIVKFIESKQKLLT